MSRGLILRSLPKRLHEKHGGFWYVHQNKWTLLSRDYAEALRIYAGIVAPHQGGMPELIDRYMGSLKVAPKTLATYTVVAKRLKVAFQEFFPDQVKPAHFYQYITAKKITAAMASHYRSVLVGVMQLAVEEGLVEQNLIREVKQYQSPKRDRLISDGEWNAIYDKACPRLRVIMDLAHMTGQRISDVLKIKYSDLTDDGVYVIQGKTKAREIIAWNPDLEAAVAKAKTLHASVRGMTLFHGHRGEPVSYWTTRSQWNKACKDASVVNAHIHDMRAKAATTAKKEGRDSKALLGHKSDATHDRYLRDKDVPIVQGNRRVKP